MKVDHWSMVVCRAQLHARRHVEAEADVAVGALAELLSVDVDGAVRHDAVKFDEDPASRERVGKGEVLAVPADPGREIGASSRGRGLGVERPLDAPVVRDVERSPRRIREGRPLCPGGIAQEEEPAGVEGQDGAYATGDRRGGRSARARPSPRRHDTASPCGTTSGSPGCRAACRTRATAPPTIARAPAGGGAPSAYRRATAGTTRLARTTRARAASGTGLGRAPGTAGLGGDTATA
jgi:hypothetical protein